MEFEQLQKVPTENLGYKSIFLFRRYVRNELPRSESSALRQFFVKIIERTQKARKFGKVVAKSVA